MEVALKYVGKHILAKSQMKKDLLIGSMHLEEVGWGYVSHKETLYLIL